MFADANSRNGIFGDALGIYEDDETGFELGFQFRHYSQ